VSAVLFLYTCFSFWMAFDSLKRGANLLMFIFLLCIPFAAFLYFVLVYVPAVARGEGTPSSDGATGIPGPMKPRVNISALRATFEENDCHDHRLALARGLVQLNELTEAKDVLRPLVNNDADDPEPIYLYARCVIADGDWPLAIRLLEKVRDLDLAFYEYNPWLDLSHAHIQAGNPDSGLEVLRELIKESPRVKHKTILARALFQTGSIEESRSLVKEAISDFEEATFYMQRESQRWYREACELLNKIQPSSTT